MAEAIGILGGTFDPFHHGHLRLAIECRERLRLQQLLLVPLYSPPHREAPVASAKQRLDMLSLAVSGHDFLHIEDCELRRRDVSYTIDTIKHLRGMAEKTPLCLLMGRDAFNALAGWRDWQDLSTYTHIVVVDRPGGYPGKIDGQLQQFIEQHRTEDINDLHIRECGNLYELEIPLLDISATRLRDTIRSGNDPSGLLPKSVIEYIYTHSLYQQDN